MDFVWAAKRAANVACARAKARGEAQRARGEAQRARGTRWVPAGRQGGYGSPLAQAGHHLQFMASYGFNDVVFIFFIL